MRSVFNDRQGFRPGRRSHDRDSRLDDACLFGGNFRQCIAEPLLMVERDVGDDTGERRHDVRRIQPSTQAGFPNDQVAVLFGKKLKRHDRDHFKEGRMMAGGEPVPQRLDLRDEPYDFILGNQPAVYLNALTERDQMRRSKKSHPQAGCAIDAFQHRAGRTFAIGAGDVDETESLLRIAHQCSELESVFQAELCAEQAERIKKFDGSGVGHVGQSPNSTEIFSARRRSLPPER